MRLKGAMLFRIEYEIIPKMDSWTAHVVAKSAEDATNYIQRYVRKEIRVSSCGMVSNVDAVSPLVLPSIGPIGNPIKPKNEKPKEEVSKTQESDAQPATGFRKSIIKK